MNPLQAIPETLRKVLYLVYAALGPVLIYTAAKGWTGDAEYQFYIGFGIAWSLTAASNVNTGGEYVGEHRAPDLGIEFFDEDQER